MINTVIFEFEFILILDPLLFKSFILDVLLRERLLSSRTSEILFSEMTWQIAHTILPKALMVQVSFRTFVYSSVRSRSICASTDNFFRMCLQYSFKISRLHCFSSDAEQFSFNLRWLNNWPSDP